MKYAGEQAKNYDGIKPRIMLERQQARSYSVEKSMGKTSLEVQWLEILPVQGAEACVPPLLKPARPGALQQERALQLEGGPRSPQLEIAHVWQ